MSSASRPTSRSASGTSCFHAPGPDQQRFIDLYAEKVMPVLRKRFC